MNEDLLHDLDFQVLFESAPGLFLVLLPNSPKFTIVAASDAYLKATMTHRDDIIGKDLFVIFPDNPKDLKATGTSNLRSSLERVITQKKPDAMAVQKYDIKRPKSEGGGFEVRYWSPLNSPVKDKSGKVKYIIHRVEDVTDFVNLKHKGAEQSRITEDLRSRAGEMELEIYQRAQEIQKVNKKLQVANGKLNELDRLKTEFFTNISHEFRTPLTLMLSPLEETLGNKTLPPDVFEKLDLVYRNSLRLQRLVNNLLDFSSIEAGKHKSVFQPEELGSLTKSLASTFQSAMEDAGLEFKIDCKPLAKKVYIDYNAWEKIVFNLLSNALKFTLKGGIEVSIKDDGKYAKLIVKDSGAGIPAAELPHMFERFHRIKGTESRTVEGSGIGLAMINELVKLHKGKIMVDSKLNEGTTFTISIPYGSSHLPKDQIVEHKSSNTLKKFGSHKAYLNEARSWLKKDSSNDKKQLEDQRSVKSRWKEHILVVDDNADMRDYIYKILDENTSLSVETAKNGKDALQSISKKLPSLVITDIMMPEMDGFELVANIRKNKAMIQVPIIFLSARAGQSQKVEGIAEGVDDYLVKPFTVNELLAHVYTRLNLVTLRKDTHTKSVNFK